MMILIREETILYGWPFWILITSYNMNGFLEVMIEGKTPHRTSSVKEIYFLFKPKDSVFTVDPFVYKLPAIQ